MATRNNATYPVSANVENLSKEEIIKYFGILSNMLDNADTGWDRPEEYGAYNLGRSAYKYYKKKKKSLMNVKAFAVKKAKVDSILLL